MYTGLVPSGNAASYWEDRSEAADMKSFLVASDWSLSLTALENVENDIVEVPFVLSLLGWVSWDALQVSPASCKFLLSMRKAR